MKYIFRNLTVLDYNEETQELTTEMVDGIQAAVNCCHFIDKDYINLEQFFHDINMNRNDATYPLKDIIVN